MPPVFTDLRIAPAAAANVEAARARVAASQRDRVETVLADAAFQNGDAYLNAAETQTVVDAFEAASASGTLSGAALDTAIANATSAIAELSLASNVDGMSVHFTGTDNVTQKLVDE